MKFDDNANFCITKEEIIRLFSITLMRLADEDSHLLKSDAHERSIQSRLVAYMRESFRFAETGGLRIDAEYNRDGEKDTKIGNPSDETAKGRKKIFLDIILHERGSADYAGDDKYKNDILYCELKKKPAKSSEDAARIKKQMKVRKYQFGIEVTCISSENIRFNFYEHREPKTSHRINCSRYWYDCARNKLTLQPPVRAARNYTDLSAPFPEAVTEPVTNATAGRGRGSRQNGRG